jgi:SpoIID/LytB domain protein
LAEGMNERTSLRRLVLAVALVVATACTGDGGRAGAGTPPATTAPTAATTDGGDLGTPSRSPSVPPVEAPLDRVTLVAPAGGSILVHGTYPAQDSPCVRPVAHALDARYPGSLVAVRANDGTITLTVTLPFESYLEGIAEMPASWPEAALRAQAIAARTYALASTGWRGRPGEKLGSPICATTSCQVFRGIPVTDAASMDIERWYAAVHATSGQVLVFDGRPAETLYSSTSNGRTHGNDEVFGTAPLPYLRPVPEHADLASPTSHWRASVPLDDLAAFLRAADQWPHDRPVARVSRRGSNIVVAGSGVTRTMTVATFRSAINAWAPCLRPDVYPPPSWKGTPLPVTIPSLFFRLIPEDGSVDIVGRGSGHGVGMMQWGAYGRAIHGASAEQILAYYYGGLRPVRFTEPKIIRVQVATGLSSVSVEPSGPGARLDGRPIEGTVRIDGGSALTITS